MRMGIMPIIEFYSFVDHPSVLFRRYFFGPEVNHTHVTAFVSTGMAYYVRIVFHIAE
jgi:hypothetical protein